MAASAGALRRAEGFVRYAVSVQYHGGSFLGFTYQGPKGEDCIVPQRKKKSGRVGTVDLRGHRSVEGRLREALDDLFGGKNQNHRQWENIQVSSRTDRGVHALKNTFHVDIRTLPNHENRDEHAAAATTKHHQQQQQQQQQQDSDHDESTTAIERKLKDGLNFYLSRQAHGFSDNPQNRKQKQNPARMNELRILNASKSPEFMDNPYAITKEGKARNQTFRVDWNARFSATQRTYVYRLLCYFPRKQHDQQQENDNSNNNDKSSTNETESWQNDWNNGGYGYEIPFEWDRAWCLPQNHTRPLNVEAMKEAAEHFVGTHDFSSFRGRLCVRNSPIVTMKSVRVSSEMCHPTGISGFLGIFDANARQPLHQQQQQQQQQLVTITFVANSFLYRQVRNMVGCLVEVGKHGGRLSPGDVKDLLQVSSANNNSHKNSSNLSHKNSEEGASSSEGENGNSHSTTTIKAATSSNQTKFKHRLYSTAPPQGLFLVDVQHGNFWF